MPRWPAAIALALFPAADVAPAQQLPVYGCRAAVSCSGSRGFRTLTGGSGGMFRLPTNDAAFDVSVRLTLPPPPDLPDREAVEVAVPIVLSRNRRLADGLAAAQAASASPARSVPEAGLARGEFLIRVKGRPGPPPRRDEPPRDAFAAMALRRAVYPQFSAARP